MGNIYVCSFIYLLITFCLDGQYHTYGDLKVDRLITNFPVDHCGFQERSKEEKFLNLACSTLLKIIKNVFIKHQLIFYGTIRVATAQRK